VEEDALVRRLGLGFVVATLALTSLLAGRTSSASAAPGRPHAPTSHHGDWFVTAENAYDVPAADGSTDLVYAIATTIGPGFTGGTPSFFVQITCGVLHHWNPAGGGSFTTGEEGDVVAGLIPGPPPPTYVSGYGQVSGANVNPGPTPPVTTSVYSAVFAGGESPATASYGPGAAGVFPGYTQGTVTSQGWNHFNDVTGTRYADSGTMNVSVRGVLASFTGPTFVFPPSSFTTGALQCQLGSQPTDTVGLTFVLISSVGSSFTAGAL
jgi:hypothetical protein